jgi:hypothetical protein
MNRFNRVTNHDHLNTIEDNRWEIFQNDARRCRLVAFGVTVTSLVIAYALQTIWIFLAGELGLWLLLRYWRTKQK